MEFIHIKNLEKFHPGYKDRGLIWAKVYFSTVQGDPEMEMIKDEIDRWRFVAMICLELQSKKPLPNTDDYWGLKFNIKKRPMSKTLDVLRGFIERVTLTGESLYPREEKSREENMKKSREDVSPVLEHWNAIAKANGLATIIALSDKRETAVRARAREPEFDLDKIALEISQSDFLRGLKGDGWKCTFDFVFCSSNNYLKILEGKYRNGNSQQRRNPNSAISRATFTHTEADAERIGAIQESLEQRDRERRERSGSD